MRKQQENYLTIPSHIQNIQRILMVRNGEKTERLIINHGIRVLLAHVYGFGRRGCWEKNETLAEMFFCGPRTISMRIAILKKAGLILWLHPKGYYRTLWAKSHPEVKAADTLLYRGQEIPISDIISGQAKSGPLRNKLRGDCAKSCEATAQESNISLRKKLPQTNNTTMKDITADDSATPTPLTAGGQVPALLADRNKDAQAQIEQLKHRLGVGKHRREPKLSSDEFERRRQKQIAALEKNL